MELTFEEEAYTNGDRSNNSEPLTDPRLHQLLAAASFSNLINNPLDIVNALMLQSDAVATLAKSLHLSHNMLQALASTPTTMASQDPTKACSTSNEYQFGSSSSSLPVNVPNLDTTPQPIPPMAPRPTIVDDHHETNNITNPSSTTLQEWDDFMDGGEASEPYWRDIIEYVYTTFFLLSLFFFGFNAHRLLFLSGEDLEVPL